LFIALVIAGAAVGFAVGTESMRLFPRL